MKYPKSIFREKMRKLFLNMSSAEIVHRRNSHKPRVMFRDGITNVP